MIRSSLLFIDDDLSATTCLSRGVAYSLISLVQTEVQCRQLHAWLLPKTQPRSVPSELRHGINEASRSVIPYNVHSQPSLSFQCQKHPEEQCSRSCFTNSDTVH